MLMWVLGKASVTKKPAVWTKCHYSQLACWDLEIQHNVVSELIILKSPEELELIETESL